MLHTMYGACLQLLLLRAWQAALRVLRDCNLCFCALLLWEPRLPALAVRMTRLPHGLCRPVQVMKLAVQHRHKALVFISSVGVAAPLGMMETIYETRVGADFATEFPASGGYAYGWAAASHVV